ncbi:MAG: hypothetical protein A2Y73_08140 [Chloroflexi bacterium RBG_13_56_8]|nr:MAG: hypothetical protein A2Y73_08140 [Chloroflexi bacterium RBG_13_56_8]
MEISLDHLTDERIIEIARRVASDQSSRTPRKWALVSPVLDVLVHDLGLEAQPSQPALREGLRKRLQKAVSTHAEMKYVSDS